jgi:hypothetical protein
MPPDLEAPTPEHPVEQTAWDRPIFTEAQLRAMVEGPPSSDSAATIEARETTVEEAGVAEPSLAPRRLPLTVGLCLVAFAATTVAGTRIADNEGWLTVADTVPRVGALIACWAALVLLVRRCGGRTIIIGAFAAVALGLVGGYPEPWALAGAAVTGAAAFALLGMLLTRPARGLAVIGELVVSAFIGVMGAIVVAGFDVELRPYRFRVLILALVLTSALALAWRLGQGARSIGRRGVVIVVVGVLLLVGALAYAQAVRTWGSPDLLRSLADFRDWISESIGASPRPIEALVGFPALVWGVAVRHQRRQGWWVCAFGALGAAGIVSSLIDPTTALREAMLSTGYDVLLGAVIGLFVVGLDRLLTHGGGRRADATIDVDPERPEPPRFQPLL